MNTPSTGSAARSRSFVRLRGFARVGGVLIGQTLPQSSPKLALRDISWSIEDGKVRLTLTDGSGKTYRSRAHRATLVNQALTFAADGRPVAVTMVTAAPLPELKILVHPALVDTAMGHRVIELDRFVDTYARSGVRAAEAEVHDQYALYQFAWAARVQSLDLPSLVQTSNDEDVTRLLQAIGANAATILQDEELRGRAAAAWRRRTFGHPNALLVKKDEYFDATLVQWLIRNTGRYTGLEQIQEALQGLPTPEDKETLERRILPPPEFQVWSGVREMTPTANLSDVLMIDGAAPPSVLDFMLQVAFTTEPSFGTDEKDPWEFPAVAGDIRALVRASVAKDARSRMVLQDSEEFAMLQRLFRLALAGDFGRAFPVEKLAGLSDAISKYAPKTAETPRWNPLSGALEARRLFASESERRMIDTVIALRRDLNVAKAERVTLTSLPPIQ